MKRSAFLLVTTAGMILAGAGVTEIIGDASGDAPPTKALAEQRYVTDAVAGIHPAACLRLDSGYGDR
ncbi:hypothetical protein [Nocardia seriolae]|uniref:Uncharacterized protein n=1 Tax=Nocardia seriolae TaxID=37332 RepID=A0A0B8NCD1_9NOCA|nr:hypothetical protein [Nocardia seriolae]APB00413.1 hypothetical protein NS506_06377 [Nocardia seriolae]MTJ62088.1 hypothetical protein [Nocardia seriolae]MTJ75087.1 hypothetical protein [Nocardia seriolae]MTJ89886.1 hypothetical protein [Nocardia seriolae]MTK33861.1 hypothetical protein [Nocardia seriolae]